MTRLSCPFDRATDPRKASDPALEKPMRTIKKYIPLPIKKVLRTAVDETKFASTGSRTCNTKNLRSLKDDELQEILSRARFDEEYSRFLDGVAHFQMSQAPGGVNDGDRRAIYHLVRRMPAFHILEIGTHVGASTISIGEALKKNSEELGSDVSLTSVDIIDVNGEQGAFHGLNLPYSPKEMINKIDAAGFTDFRVSTALDFLTSTRQHYDLIFLDGDHSPAAVYNEIPLALERLSPDGLILLHDYFPNGQKIWPGSEELIVGPYRAVRKHMNQSPDLDVKPLGRLEWPTKLGTNDTSLAVLRKG